MISEFKFAPGVHKINIDLVNNYDITLLISFS